MLVKQHPQHHLLRVFKFEGNNRTPVEVSRKIYEDQIFEVPPTGEVRHATFDESFALANDGTRYIVNVMICRINDTTVKLEDVYDPSKDKATIVASGGSRL